mgnify:CR=1 FL=1
MPKRCLHLLDLGIQPYGAVHEIQLALVDKRQSDEIGDVLILVEHTPVITLGRRGNEKNILASAELLAREGIAVHRVERGGDVTYHGPGQLVGYPILKLTEYGLGPSDYMHRLEDVIAATLSDYGIGSHRREKIIGVWVGENKIAALGVRIRRGVSFHGFALNVAPNMRHWEYIIPCGIRDGGVTSLAQELGSAPPMAEVKQRVVVHLAERFGVDIAEVLPKELGLDVP